MFTIVNSREDNFNTKQLKDTTKNKAHANNNNNIKQYFTDNLYPLK